MADSKDNYIIVGKVSGVFGVKGWVRVYSHTEPRDNILRYKTWFLEQRGQWVPFTLTSGRQHGKGIIAQLDGINDRDIAATLVQRKVAIDSSQLPELDNGEFYWRDLLGLEVHNSDGTAFGKVVDFLETGSNDVLIARNGEVERLIPYIPEQVILDIDLDNAKITVDWDPEF